ncbi:hypothetical protein XELAEV_18041667mg [Xenopus laevis]|uniref:Uncharacterized protein n=1 Tax=Xenopus laevis TaxID=8355 RepID=A0A974C2T0_XENLA|nr:hypothetical protein XELAEV_18041667mg [Xenopus laevis]
MLEGGEGNKKCRRQKGSGTSRMQHMKMLEICLKLVGCKSKKGLSSSSSCYLEGEIRGCQWGKWGGRREKGGGLNGPRIWLQPSGVLQSRIPFS